MSAFRFPRACRAVSSVVARHRWARKLTACAVVTTGVAVASCSGAHHQSQSFPMARGVHNPAISLQRAHMAQTEKPDVRELEDDGLPVQRAPFRRLQREADDPTEPFSPNYGKPASRVKSWREQQATLGAVPDADTPPVVRAASFRKLDAVEAELVISRAIAEHERRNP